MNCLRITNYISHLSVVTWAMFLKTEDHIQYSLEQYKNTEVVYYTVVHEKYYYI